MGLLGGFLPRLVGGDSSLTALLGHSLIERLKLTLLWSLFIAFVGLLGQFLTRLFSSYSFFFFPFFL